MFNQFLDSIESLAKMMNEIEFHDTILVSRDEQEFPVHRNILAVRSNVFKDMFLQDKFVRGLYILQFFSLKWNQFWHISKVGNVGSYEDGSLVQSTTFPLTIFAICRKNIHRWANYCKTAIYI